MNTILQGARVIDPANGVDEIREVAFSGDGIIVDPDSIRALADTKAVDVAGKTVCPGLIDMHVHLREPGQEYKEDIATGTDAAAAGGITTVLAMPNTIPAIDRPEHVELLHGLIAKKAKVNVLISACLSEDRAGIAAADIRGVVATGKVTALTDDGNCVPDRDLMKQIMELSVELGYVVVDHCEDRCVWNNGVIRESSTSDLMQVPGQPRETEINIVRRNIELCRETGCAMHMQHISTSEATTLVREAIAEGLPVSAEVTPHHFALTHRDVLLHGANAKMNPPLGEEEDRLALIEAVADGTIAVICTDHAPHAPHEKCKSIQESAFGIIGLETALPLSLTVLYHSGLMSLSDVIARFTSGPSEILGIDAGTLSIGKPADITIFDPDEPCSIDIHSSRSKSRNSPFHGYAVRGKVYGTICGGEWVYQAN